MPASTAPTQTFWMNQKQTVHVAVFMPDGVTPDNSTPLTVSSSSTPVCGAAVDPNNNRAVVLTANSVAGSANITVSIPGTSNPLTIPVTTTPPPNMSRVEYVSSDPPVPK